MKDREENRKKGKEGRKKEKGKGRKKEGGQAYMRGYMKKGGQISKY